MKKLLRQIKTLTWLFNWRINRAKIARLQSYRWLSNACSVGNRRSGAWIFARSKRYSLGSHDSDTRKTTIDRPLNGRGDFSAADFYRDDNYQSSAVVCESVSLQKIVKRLLNYSRQLWARKPHSKSSAANKLSPIK